jgi:hypothetical protein
MSCVIFVGPSHHLFFYALALYSSMHIMMLPGLVTPLIIVLFLPTVFFLVIPLVSHEKNALLSGRYRASKHGALPARVAYGGRRAQHGDKRLGGVRRCPGGLTRAKRRVGAGEAEREQFGGSSISEGRAQSSGSSNGRFGSQWEDKSHSPHRLGLRQHLLELCRKTSVLHH